MINGFCTLTVLELLVELPETMYCVSLPSLRVKMIAAMLSLALMVGYAVRLSSVTLLPSLQRGSAVRSPVAASARGHVPVAMHTQRIMSPHFLPWTSSAVRTVTGSAVKLGSACQQSLKFTPSCPVRADSHPPSVVGRVDGGINSRSAKRPMMSTRYHCMVMPLSPVFQPSPYW